MKFRMMGVAATVLAMAALSTTSGLAHHSVAAKFDESKTTTLTGIVTLSTPLL